jgi:uncharacterized protein (TIGR00369 family)
MAGVAARSRFGVVPLEQVRTMSGMDMLRAMREGRLPAPPICQSLDFDLAEVEFGRVVFEGRPAGNHYNPLGTVHGGYTATLLDSCLGCAIHSTLPAGQGYTTVEVKVNFVRALTDRTGVVRAEGKVINVGSRIATSEARLTDGAGKLLAHGTTTCLVFPI